MPIGQKDFKVSRSFAACGDIQKSPTAIPVKSSCKILINESLHKACQLRHDTSNGTFQDRQASRCELCLVSEW